MRMLQPAMEGAITSMSCTPDGRLLLCGTSTGQARLWDLIKQVPAAEAFPLHAAITQVTMGAEPDLALIVCGKEVSLFDPWHPLKHSPPLAVAGLETVALQAQGQRLLLGLKNGQAQLRDIEQGNFVGWPLPHRGPVSAAAFVSDGGIVVTGDAGGILYGWSVETGQPTGETVRMDGSVIFCQSMPQQGSIVAVSSNGEVRFWEPASETVSSHRVRKPLRGAAISRYGTLVALSQRDMPAIHVWEMHGRTIEPRYLAASARPPIAAVLAMKPAPASVPKDTPFCWDSEGKNFAMLDEDGRVCIGDRKVTMRSAVRVLALSGDGTHLATAGADRNASLWRLGDQVPVPLELQHNSPVQHLAFTPDHRRLVTVTDEGELRCWDVATGEPLMPPVNRGERIKSMCIAEKGRMVCYERVNGGWFMFPIPQQGSRQPEWFLHFAEAMARRRLNENSSTETLSYAAVGKAIDSIPPATAFDDLAVRQLAHWLVSDPSRRPLWPGDEGTFDDYLHELIATHEPAALREVLRFDPLNGAAVAVGKGTSMDH